MKPSIYSIERAVDEKYYKLNGEELAAVVNSKVWDLATSTKTVPDRAKLKEDLDHIVKRYGRKLSFIERDKYRVKRYEHDMTRMLEVDLKRNLSLLYRIDDMVKLLLVQLYLRWIHEIGDSSPEEIGTPEWIENRDSLRDSIPLFRTYQQVVKAQIQEIVNVSFWKDHDISPPSVPDDAIDTECEPYFNEMDQLIEEQKRLFPDDI